MFAVYWTTIQDDGSMKPQAEYFPDENGLSASLAFLEKLREEASRHGHLFISLSSENPNSVGKPGKLQHDADYSWKKRRP